MVRGMLLVVGLVGCLFASELQAAPAPASESKAEVAEALLYLKRLPGKTAEEQAASRAHVLRRFRIAMDDLVLKPDTQLPGFKGPDGVRERLVWSADNVKLGYLEDTGVLRITCRGGTARERAAFVNATVKACLAAYEEQKAQMRRGIEISQEFIKTSTAPGAARARADALARIRAREAFLARMPEITILDLAALPDE
jgi:hypothetical protein